MKQCGLVAMWLCGCVCMLLCGHVAMWLMSWCHVDCIITSLRCLVLGSFRACSQVPLFSLKSKLGTTQYVHGSQMSMLRHSRYEVYSSRQWLSIFENRQVVFNYFWKPIFGKLCSRIWYLIKITEPIQRLFSVTDIGYICEHITTPFCPPRGHSIHPFIHPFIHSFIIHSFIHSLIHSFIHSFIHSLSHSLFTQGSLLWIHITLTPACVEGRSRLEVQSHGLKSGDQ